MARVSAAFTQAWRASAYDANGRHGLLGLFSPAASPFLVGGGWRSLFLTLSLTLWATQLSDREVLAVLELEGSCLFTVGDELGHGRDPCASARSFHRH